MHGAERMTGARDMGSHARARVDSRTPSIEQGGRSTAPLAVTSTGRIGREGAAEPRPRPFIKRGAGGTVPLNPSPSASPHSCFLLSSAMARGRGDASSVAARVSARQRIAPPQELVAAEPAARGRGRGRGRGRRGARGRGGRGGRSASPPPTAPPPWRATPGTTLANSSSGCASHRVIAFASRLHLRGRWSWIRRRRCGCI